MERKSIIIDIPDGMCIDESKSTFERIVFKPIDTKPRSWEEYCKQQAGKCACGYEIVENAEIQHSYWSYFTTNLTNPDMWKNTLPSKELAEAFLAMMQLMSLRQAWIGDWEPDWENRNQLKSVIMCQSNKYFCVVSFRDLCSRPLAFPTSEMAKEFQDCFKDLLNVARLLI